LDTNGKLLWVGPLPPPENVRQALDGLWGLDVYQPDQPLGPQLRPYPLAVFHPNGAGDSPSRLGQLLDQLERTSTVGLFLLPPQATLGRELLQRRRGQYLCADPDAGPSELRAQVQAAQALQPTIENLLSELSAANTIIASGTRTLEGVDEEMRLAARLQRDFLPRRLPELGAIRFGVLYRPASWVSGDIYDIIRLDETHLGFYVVDAVGHGMPAALLTMFIKKALQTKRILDNSYQIVPPDVSLTELNTDICEQGLTSCQFCTAVYCVLDASDLTMTFARAGHPDPVLIRRDGQIEVLSLKGSLLGVFEDEQYEAATVQLGHGDRLLLYTDGAEEVLCQSPGGRKDIRQVLAPYARMPRDQLLLHLTARAEAKPSGTRFDDDITVMVVDVLE